MCIATICRLRFKLAEQRSRGQSRRRLELRWSRSESGHSRRGDAGAVLPEGFITKDPRFAASKVLSRTGRCPLRNSGITRWSGRRVQRAPSAATSSRATWELLCLGSVAWVRFLSVRSVSYGLHSMFSGIGLHVTGTSVPDHAPHHGGHAIAAPNPLTSCACWRMGSPVVIVESLSHNDALTVNVNSLGNPAELRNKWQAELMHVTSACWSRWHIHARHMRPAAPTRSAASPRRDAYATRDQLRPCVLSQCGDRRDSCSCYVG